MQPREDGQPRNGHDTSVCGAEFLIPAECHLPPGHEGEHAPDVVARALMTLGIADDELRADIREFHREREAMRVGYASAMRRLERARLAVYSIGSAAAVVVVFSLVSVFSQTVR